MAANDGQSIETKVPNDTHHRTASNAARYVRFTTREEIDGVRRFYRYTLVAGVPASHYTGVIEVTPKGLCAGRGHAWSPIIHIRAGQDVLIEFVFSRWERSSGGELDNPSGRADFVGWRLAQGGIFTGH